MTFDKMVCDKNELIEKVIFIEGGYVDDPADSGGKTKYGITEETARSYGFTQPIQVLTKDEAISIYSKKFYDKMMLDFIKSKEMVYLLLNIGVHAGTFMAIKFFQRVLNINNNRGKLYTDINVDGYNGKKTLGALKKYIDHRGDSGYIVLCKMIECLYGEFLISLVEKREKDEKFIYGWFSKRFEI